MPDLALLTDQDPNSKVVWIADPKYSEMGSYQLPYYVRVAERYRDAFKPAHVWICEFFPRQFPDISHESRNNISVVADVRPDGAGTITLRRALRSLHRFESSKFVLAIDCSGSFVDNIPVLADELIPMARSAGKVFCFASSVTSIATTEVSLESILSTGRALGGGTLLNPLLMALQQDQLLTDEDADLVLITDGEYSDNSAAMDAALNRIFRRVISVAHKPEIEKLWSELRSN